MESRKKIQIATGEALTVLKLIPSVTHDGCFFDGPYGLGFLGQNWDGGVPSLGVCQELLRVCKPGSWLLAFGHPRTFHRLMGNIEDAGWKLRDTLMWLYGQGFPKSHDLGKKLGDAAWNGYGFALKPGYEPIILAMKPIDGSFADNDREWAVAGLSIDGCRIGDAGQPSETACVPGRYPANVILDEEAAHLLDLHGPVSKNGKYRKTGPTSDLARGWVVGTRRVCNRSRIITLVSSPSRSLNG